MTKESISNIGKSLTLTVVDNSTNGHAVTLLWRLSPTWWRGRRNRQSSRILFPEDLVFKILVYLIAGMAAVQFKYPSSVKDVDQHKFVKAFAAFLKK